MAMNFAVISADKCHTEVVLPPQWVERIYFGYIERPQRRNLLVDCRPSGGPIIEMGVDYFSGGSFAGWARTINEDDLVNFVWVSDPLPQGVHVSKNPVQLPRHRGVTDFR